MDKRNTYKVVLDIPLLYGERDKYSSHPDQPDLGENCISLDSLKIV